MCGGSLGLMSYDGSSCYISNGYAIEFDNWYNSGDPSSNHNALVSTNTNAPYNHITYVNTNIANEDNLSHLIEVRVCDNKVQLLVDGNVQIDYNYNFDKTYRAIGFSAATGGYTNNHWIERFVILAKYTCPEPTIILGNEETC
jgi:hypothetical protein